ncbi:unnamed protein product [Clonostachys byssicola]|uniref:Xylanolytic transcriptional activator regulatory domain-containing protein n=1 Tax=Clonostachys byssicola TaxID=160290 RepID=A0A9N9XW94_9HYPO|nr:unnamed protein product [Clonostachys byssicola]
MLIACERWFLPSMDCVTVDTVIYAYLLAAHYLCNRQTRAAFLTLGTTVRAAQSIGLNREAQWGEVSDIERETRRCAWWSVFIGAGFISMSWGTPPMLSEADCQVRHPTDVEDASNLEQCPGFGSLEKREDGEIRPVTVGSYNRYKAEMYKIAITIMRRVYFTKYRKPEELTQLISKLHQRLLALEKSIPPELRVENHTHHAMQGGPNMVSRKIFAVQALTLQVSYDNMQIFLFRPLISIGGIPRSLAGTRENSPGLTNQTNLGNAPSLLLDIAHDQCWTSAMRTSMVGQSSDIMKLSQFTFPAVHVGVHTFSAGVMLGLLALTSPLSARGQESKRAIAKIIQVPKMARLKTHVWGQMTQILTDLMHVIAAEETKALIAGVAGDGSKETLTEPEVFGQPSNPYEGLEANARTADLADGVSITATDGTHYEEHATLRMNLPTAVDGSTCEMVQTLHSSGPFITGSEDQQAQFDVFEAPNLWIPQQPADPLQMMDQLWMWDGSFSYH